MPIKKILKIGSERFRNKQHHLKKINRTTVKKTFLSITLILFALLTRAQTPTVAQLKAYLDTSKNINAFLTYGVKKKFYIDSAIIMSLNNYRTNEEKVVATGKLGKVYGPFADKKKKSYLIKLLYTSPSTYYHLKHILIDSSVFKGAYAQKLADSIITKINDGRASFEEMVSTYSGDLYSQKRGGEMGWYIKGGSLPEINRELVKRKNDELFVVATRGGLHIIKIEERKETTAFGVFLKVFL